MLTRRSLIIRTAGATVVATATAAYVGTGTAFASPVAPTSGAGLRTFIDGAAIDQARVVEWERRRLSVAAARLRKDYVGLLTGELDSLLTRFAVHVDDIPAARAAMARARVLIGPDGLRELLAGELVASEAATRATLAASGGRWVLATVEIASDRGSAQGFVDTFDRARVNNDLAFWTDACPDHYIIATQPDGLQEVIEVTGGAVLASRFLVNYAVPSKVVVPADPAYPLSLAGAAVLSDGEVIGGVCHQFRDEPGGGFRSQLKVAFPAAVPGLYVSEHKWHLATEFGNWIAAYLR
ncbi:hypothetical protein ACLMAJ_31520 [Nocardia sp. KC 131]|uniref:hypothetical protein n=1 Tax=Nocardia arseniciresistens TaxID=3392119 RepID=UPI00398ECAE4